MLQPKIILKIFIGLAVFCLLIPLIFIFSNQDPVDDIIGLLFIIIPTILVFLFASPLIIMDHARKKMFYATEAGLVYKKTLIPWENIKKINLEKKIDSFTYQGTKFNETLWIFIIEFNDLNNQVNLIKVKKVLKSHNKVLKTILEKSIIYKFEIDIKEWLKDNPWFNNFQ